MGGMMVELMVAAMDEWTVEMTVRTTASMLVVM